MDFCSLAPRNSRGIRGSAPGDQGGPARAGQRDASSRHRSHPRPEPSRLFISLVLSLTLATVATALLLRSPREDSGTLSSATGPPTNRRKREWPAARAASAVVASTTAQVASCDYYASPTGTGNGLSASSPFRVSSFWPVASPGKTLCLLDGTYSGDASMILPPQGLSGTSGLPITIRAVNDGKVLITGQGQPRPVRLSYNDWFVIEGINACCSSDTRGGTRILQQQRRPAGRRLGCRGRQHQHLRSALRLLQPPRRRRRLGNGTQDLLGVPGRRLPTVRRAWGRWERSTVVGPKMTYTLAYNNYHLTCENCLGTWSGQGMPKTYVLMDYDGTALDGYGRGHLHQLRRQAPYGIFAIDARARGQERRHQIARQPRVRPVHGQLRSPSGRVHRRSWTRSRSRTLPSTSLPGPIAQVVPFALGGLGRRYRSAPESPRT